jgi:hypothetical protein
LRAYDHGCREIEERKDALLDDVAHRLEQSVQMVPLFALRWHLA